jgi:hypothetical protein
MLHLSEGATREVQRLCTGLQVALGSSIEGMAGSVRSLAASVEALDTRLARIEDSLSRLDSNVEQMGSQISDIREMLVGKLAMSPDENRLFEGRLITVRARRDVHACHTPHHGVLARRCACMSHSRARSASPRTNVCMHVTCRASCYSCEDFSICSHGQQFDQRLRSIRLAAARKAW